MKDHSLEQLKKEYLNTSIPAELDFVVKKALKEGKVKMHKKQTIKKVGAAASVAAVAVITLTIGINSSPVFAKAVSEIPLVGNIVKVLTFKEYTYNEDTYQADIKVPTIEGLENKDLENSLNEQYLAENKELYEQFMAEVEDLKKNGGGHLGVDSGYVVKTDNDRLLSIGRYVVNTVASSSTEFKYDTIDKKNQVLITLPSLFKDDSYVDLISTNIKQQMVEKHKADENMFYWVEGVEDEPSFELFEKISKEQSFYINESDKLVISFNKYEVAPGYMGMVEFEIPTELLADILVGNEYLK